MRRGRDRLGPEADRRHNRHTAYVCPTCGEQIVIPLDPSEGDGERYVEDCPVCCNPNVIHIDFFGVGEPPRVWTVPE